MPGLADLELVHNGPHCSVLMLPRVAKQFKKLSAEKRSRPYEIMRILAHDGTDFLHEKKFKFEAHVKVHGKPVAIFAVKGWKVRIYGGFLSLNDKRAFVCTEIDPNKKQDQADRDALTRAAEHLAAIS